MAKVRYRSIRVGKRTVIDRFVNLGRPGLGKGGEGLGTCRRTTDLSCLKLEFPIKPRTDRSPQRRLGGKKTESRLVKDALPGFISPIVSRSGQNARDGRSMAKL